MPARNPFEVTADEVALLGKDEFRRVMNKLIRLEARRLGIHPVDIHTSLRNDDRDGGIDARVRAGTVSSRWVPANVSIWQFKAGGRPTRASIGAEFVTKRNRDELRREITGGAVYYLVVGADPVPIRKAELRAWAQEFVRAVQADAEAVVLTASDAAEWATEYPIILAEFHESVVGLRSLDQWLNIADHRVEFKVSDAREMEITAIQQRIDDVGLVHLRVFGESGIGKTRCVLEALRHVGDTVYYAPDPGKVDPRLLDRIARQEAGSLTLVVDDCDRDNARRLDGDVQSCDGRLRLLTVGNDPFYGGAARPIEVARLDEATTHQVIEAAVATLDADVTRLIAERCQGNLRLAIEIAKRTIAEGLSRVVIEGLLPVVPGE